MSPNRCLILPLEVAVAALLAGSAASGRAAAIYRDGASARSLGLAGNSVAGADNPLDSLDGNPATLSALRGPVLSVATFAVDAQGTFRNRVNPDSTLGEDGFFPALGLGTAIGPWHFGLSINPEATLEPRWRYRDAPGGLDGRTTYGEQPQDSGIIVLRTALGASLEITPQFSVGAEIGLVYNRNHLRTTYTFQSQPALAGAKTLFDLDTEGVGVDGQIGLLWKPIQSLQLGVSYRTPSRVVTDGQATGNVGVQFRNLGLHGAPNDFNYGATITNVFPQQVHAGLAWEATSRLTLFGEMDWINWANAFDAMPVHLKNGTNPVLNTLAGSRSLTDQIPLRWRNQFVWRLGAEFTLNPYWTVRTGYAFARSAVPESTLLPLTGAVPEHFLSAGLGYHRNRLAIDLAYQFAFSPTVNVGRSAVRNGEYSDSSLRIEEQFVSLTTTVGF